MGWILSVLISGRKHDERCANAKNKNCNCECHGKFHGVKSGNAAEFGEDKDSHLPIKHLIGSKIYTGHWDVIPNKYGGEDSSYYVTVSNGREICALDLRQDILNHSPDGACWGYGGSGPSQLALGLIADVLMDTIDDPEELKNKLFSCYQKFKFEVVVALDQGKGWTLTSEYISDWIDKNVL